MDLSTPRSPALASLVFSLCLTACGSSERDAEGGVNTVPSTAGNTAVTPAAPMPAGSAGTQASAAGRAAVSGAAGSTVPIAMPPVAGTGSGGRSAAGAPAGAGGSPGSAGVSGMASAAAGSPSAGSSAGAGAGAGAGAAGMSGACPHMQLKGADICTIGDSWIQIPGNQVTTLEDHMKKAGVIAEGERFDRREVSGSTLTAIIGTYDRKPMNCKILVMDGGGIDLFTTPAGNQAAVQPVVQKFKDFLAKVKTDGYVQHIIYSLYPVIPSTPNLNVNMKPGFSDACAASEVDCHLVDLEPLFMGKNIGSDRTHANNAGGVVIGDAWWKAMQDNCIAQ